MGINFRMRTVRGNDGLWRSIIITFFVCHKIDRLEKECKIKNHSKDNKQKIVIGLKLALFEMKKMCKKKQDSNKEINTKD